MILYQCDLSFEIFFSFIFTIQFQFSKMTQFQLQFQFNPLFFRFRFVP